MKFTFQQKEYAFPTSLSQITLGERIAFYRQYEIDIAAEVADTPEANPEQDELALVELNLDKACKAFSFFSKIPLEDVQAIPVTQVLNVYLNCLKQIVQQQDEIDLQTEYEWNGELWYLEHPVLTYQSAMSFNEFVSAKQIMKQMQNLKAGLWEALPYLCAVFLRRYNEPFQEKFVAPDNERLAMMNNLPLDIALSVGFFLNDSMNTFLSTFLSSAAGQEKDQASPPISTSGDGSAS
jgi:hypothetical protein